MRAMLSSELGFSKEHRDLNIKRIGYVASLITRARGVAICAPIAPYTALRREVRRINEGEGNFVGKREWRGGVVCVLECKLCSLSA